MPAPREAGGSDVERVFREQYGRAVSVLVRSFGDIDLAEEGVQDAFMIAAQRWREGGLRPARLAGSSRQRATGSSTACDGRPPGRIVRLRPRSSTRVGSPRRSWPCEMTASD
jgi:hypothetical protein